MPGGVDARFGWRVGKPTRLRVPLHAETPERPNAVLVGRVAAMVEAATRVRIGDVDDHGVPLTVDPTRIGGDSRAGSTISPVTVGDVTVGWGE